MAIILKPHQKSRIDAHIHWGVRFRRLLVFAVPGFASSKHKRSNKQASTACVKPNVRSRMIGLGAYQCWSRGTKGKLPSSGVPGGVGFVGTAKIQAEVKNTPKWPKFFSSGTCFGSSSGCFRRLIISDRDLAHARFPRNSQEPHRLSFSNHEQSFPTASLCVVGGRQK